METFPRHNRKSHRTRGHDYTQPGAYFITICTKNRECLFGEIQNGEMQLNEYGDIVTACWNATPLHFSGMKLDAFVVMPNHFHAVIWIIADPISIGATHASPLIKNETNPPTGSPHGPPSGSIGAVIGSFKSAATRRINKLSNTSGASVWQRDYDDQIIRTDASLYRIRRYIAMNPLKWELDREKPTRFK